MRHASQRLRIIGLVVAGALLLIVLIAWRFGQQVGPAAAKPAAASAGADSIDVTALERGASMPESVKTTFWGNALERRADNSKGFDLDDARLVAEAGDNQLYAATRDDPFDDSSETVVCAITTFPAQDGIPASATAPCSPVDLFNRIGLVGATGNAPDITISGLLPDGVAEVSVRLVDGRSLAAPVNDNGLLFKVDSEPATLVFEGPQGTVTHDVTIPQ